MALQWRLLDQTIQDPPVFIDIQQERCYYAREYISKGGWNASEANQLISNYKKHPRKRGTREWRYKEQAIQQFANELSSVVGKNCVLSFIPSSKAKNDPEYDSRLEDTLAVLKQQRSDLQVCEVLRMRETMEPYHGGRVSRNPDDIYRKLEWVGIPSNATHVILIDDLLTSGAHFKACKRKIQENARVEVIGVFWAKAVWLEDDAS